MQVFQNGALVTEAGVISDGLLIAAEGRIRYAGPRAGAEIPAGAEIVDAGRLLLPPGYRGPQ